MNTETLPFIHAANRKGWREGMPAIPRKYFASEAEAVGAMKDNPCVFVVQQNSTGKFEIGACGEYMVIERASKSAPWRDTGRRCFATCSAAAIDQIGIDSYGEHKRIINWSDWPAIQTRQHLRAIGISADY